MPKLLLTPAVCATVLLAPAHASSAERRELDLADARWRVVVDGVMGGLSTGRVGVTDRGTLRFTGDLSLENNGGFSQIRGRSPRGAFAGADGVSIRVKGDGRVYIFDLRASNARMRAGSYQREFLTTADEWVDLRLSFDDFRLHSFGWRVPNAPELRPELIESIGVTLAEKNEGAFEIEIASISPFYRSAASGTATTAQTSDARTSAVRLYELAIARGVPEFNAGDPAACAAIYEVAIAAMLGLGRDELGPAAVLRLELAQSEAARLHSAADRAWAYRRALDAVYEALQGRAEKNGTGQSSRAA